VGSAVGITVGPGVGTTLAGVVFTTWVVTTAVNVTAKVCTTESEPSAP
jgi:hypothetical protein